MCCNLVEHNDDECLMCYSKFPIYCSYQSNNPYNKLHYPTFYKFNKTKFVSIVAPKNSFVPIYIIYSNIDMLKLNKSIITIDINIFIHECILFFIF